MITKEWCEEWKKSDPEDEGAGPIAKSLEEAMTGLRALVGLVERGERPSALHYARQLLREFYPDFDAEETTLDWETCEWCEKKATFRLLIERRGRPENYVRHSCDAHEEKVERLALFDGAVSLARAIEKTWTTNYFRRR